MIRIQSSMGKPYYYNIATGESSWELTMLKTDLISNKPVSFNDIPDGQREISTLRGDYVDIEYEPTHFIGCNPPIVIDNYLVKMGTKPYNEKILELNLSGCRVNNDLLTHFPNLTSLNISNQRITPQQLYNIVSNSPKITSLDVSHNYNLGSEGAKAISKLTHLTYLNISGNKIGSEGAKAISKLTHLTYLNISDNGIGLEGAKAISKLTYLTFLGISNNLLGPEGAQAIAHGLSLLTTLDIRDNYIGPNGEKAISHNLKNIITLYK